MNLLFRSTYYHVTDDGDHNLITFQTADVLDGVPAGAAVTRRPTRCVRTALAGRGQINRLAGVWAPEWIRACLVLYHPQHVRVTTRRGVRSVAFSVVFMNTPPGLGPLGGHIMDFFSVNNVPLYYDWDGFRALTAVEKTRVDAGEEKSGVEDSLHAFMDSLGVH